MRRLPEASEGLLRGTNLGMNEKIARGLLGGAKLGMREEIAKGQ